jgi:hypothetical protein
MTSAATASSVRVVLAAVVSHGCRQSRGLPSGTAQPHAKQPVMGERTTWTIWDSTVPSSPSRHPIWGR